MDKKWGGEQNTYTIHISTRKQKRIYIIYIWGNGTDNLSVSLGCERSTSLKSMGLMQCGGSCEGWSNQMMKMMKMKTIILVGNISAFNAYMSFTILAWLLLVIIIGTMHKKASQIVLILEPGNGLEKEEIKIKSALCVGIALGR